MRHNWPEDHWGIAFCDARAAASWIRFHRRYPPFAAARKHATKHNRDVIRRYINSAISHLNLAFDHMNEAYR